MSVNHALWKPCASHPGRCLQAEKAIFYLVYMLNSVQMNCCSFKMGLSNVITCHQVPIRNDAKLAGHNGSLFLERWPFSRGRSPSVRGNPCCWAHALLLSLPPWHEAHCANMEYPRIDINWLSHSVNLEFGASSTGYGGSLLSVNITYEVCHTSHSLP